jgi:hypothetical protein
MLGEETLGEETLGDGIDESILYLIVEKKLILFCLTR